MPEQSSNASQIGPVKGTSPTTTPALKILRLRPGEGEFWDSTDKNGKLKRYPELTHPNDLEICATRHDVDGKIYYTDYSASSGGMSLNFMKVFGSKVSGDIPWIHSSDLIAFDDGLIQFEGDTVILRKQSNANTSLDNVLKLESMLLPYEETDGRWRKRVRHVLTTEATKLIKT